jgi:hypothetical protein
VENPGRDRSIPDLEMLLWGIKKIAAGIY